MAIDYSVRRCTRRCAATDRELAAGESFVSVLLDEGDEVVRRDYAASAWADLAEKAPPEGAIAWWRSQMPGTGDAKPAPREALLSLLDEWADKPDQAPARYLLALLLVRRRVLRLQGESFLAGLQGETTDDGPTETLRLVCRERDDPIEVVIAPPNAEEAPRLQERLAELLGAA
ncbi:hypothetical protein Pla108_11840 [Botrimarina colliarenosi]|uniref:Uncharacterized protein n=1 Tax=Botrimarina colliarenosi TaxID=2528001 RepID=A0A5C6ALA0_9BACT|nr:hypothetical protein [Botrimarina colliarenosi]TWU00237.1 hypothetical protein Pla108_11840 [Botrimarina colliarenosi]